MPRRYLDRRAEAEIEAMLEREKIAREKANAAAAAQPAREQRSATSKRPGGPRRGPGDWQGLVEQRILEGMEQGLFDDLPGAGKPLNLDEDQYVPDDLKMAFRMLRSTGLTPLWVEMNREIREDIARMERFREHIHGKLAEISAIELAHRRREYADRIKDINAKILNYNIIAPSSQVHLGMLLPDEELERFDRPPDAQL